MPNKINQQEGVRVPENKGLLAEIVGILDTGDMMLNPPDDLGEFIDREAIKQSRIEQLLDKFREVVEGAGLTDEKRVKIIQQAVKLYKAGKLKKALYDYIFDKLLQAQLQAILKAIEPQQFEDIAHECKSCGAKWIVRMLLVGDSILKFPTYTGSDTYLCPKCKSKNTIMFSGREKAIKEDK